MAANARGLISGRYRLLKLYEATQEFLHTAFQADKLALKRDAGSGHGGGAPGLPGAPLPTLATAWRAAQAAYHAPLTQHMYITGPAMCPTLNKAACGRDADEAARELLVVRLLRRPGPRDVEAGDVVAFHSPLAVAEDETHVMVRRVAAVEGQEMVSSSGVETPFFIPQGHCWVLADNPELDHSEVIDSRSYGHIPYSNIIGRVIYAAASRQDHGPVRNSPEHDPWDEAVVAAEVDVASLFDDDDESDNEGRDEGGDEEEEKKEGDKAKREGTGKGAGAERRGSQGGTVRRRP